MADYNDTMLPPPFQNARVLTGPTGAGKTPLALRLAERLGAEIISMDSMALYRGMDIGTAKPTPEERARVPHHLVDVLGPWEASSVAWWLGQAQRIGEEIQGRGMKVLFVGGTPLYLKALLFGIFEGPAADEALRTRLEAEAHNDGPRLFHERLARVDPVSAARLHPHDTRRIIRALEVFELTGKPMSQWQVQWGQEPGARDQEPGTKRQEGVGSSVLWLDLAREELYERINERVKEMFRRGWVEEVRALAEEPRGMSRAARQALGYKEVLAHLRGERGLADTMVQVQTRTRHFAKRQITWFRHLPGCRPASSELTWTLWDLTMQNEPGLFPG